ncbi:MAG: pyridoxal-phosphate dependent enzyme [Sandaracinaceae bacterium]
MTLLSDRWAGMRHVPWVELTRAPTAVARDAELSTAAGADVWIKRDDLTSHEYGGNKIRKLEFTLADALAEEARAVVTSGAAGSHHALATATHAAALGLHVHVCSFPQRYSTHAERNLRALVRARATVHPVASPALIPSGVAWVGAQLRLQRQRPYAIPPGGSSVLGTLGYVEAGLEIARQIEGGLVPEPSAVFVALGSGGTAAGAAIGLAAAGLTSRLVAVRVVPRAIASRRSVGRLIDKTVSFLRKTDARFPDVAAAARALVDIDGSEYGRGYGEPTSSGRNAGRLARKGGVVELDPTYTEKAVAALLRRGREELRGRPLLYVHTCAPAPEPESGEGPLPEPLRRLLRR